MMLSLLHGTAGRNAPAIYCWGASAGSSDHAVVLSGCLCLTRQYAGMLSAVAAFYAAPVVRMLAGGTTMRSVSYARAWGLGASSRPSTHARTALHSSAKHMDKVKEIDAQIGADDLMTSSTTSEDGKVNLYAYNATGLEDLLVSWGQPKFRAKQLWQWLHVRGTTDFDLMLDIPKAMRAKLKEVSTLGTLELAVEQVSKDGTVKRAYQLHDGQMIESVLMPYKDGRRTACISSQAGCAMGCVFCATGQMGFARQLTSSEILEQVQRFHVELAAKGERLSNVVFMGMGEPLGNYNNVLEAVRRINTEIGIGARHITISTVGLVPRIQRLSQEGLQVKLAVSLHAASDVERSAIMPVNVRWPLDELMAACNDYVEKTGRRITFEWALIG